jgi:hypothetical protein
MTQGQRTAAGGHPYAPAAGYRLTVPEGWCPVELEPGRRERSVAALVKRQFAGIDNAPHLKAQAREQLLAQTLAAQSAGGLEMFLSLDPVAGIPLAASLVVFLVPPSGAPPSNADDLAQSLTDAGRPATVVRLPADLAVRTAGRRSSPDGLESATLEVFVPVPHNGEWLLLSFATPVSPLVPALTKLFDAICTTLRWDN